MWQMVLIKTDCDPNEVSAVRLMAQYFTKVFKFARVSINAPTFCLHTSWDDEQMICHRFLKSHNGIKFGIFTKNYCWVCSGQAAFCVKTPDLICQECVRVIHLVYCLHFVLLGTNSSPETRRLSHRETSAVPRESNPHLWFWCTSSNLCPCSAEPTPTPPALSDNDDFPNVLG